MSNSFEEKNFAFVYVRPGTEGKAHPIGTVAVELTPVDDHTSSVDDHRVGFARNENSEAWDASRGRTVAAGRASRSKFPIIMTGPKSMRRRELVLRALGAVLDASVSGTSPTSPRFEQALTDTIQRLQKAVAKSV